MRVATSIFACIAVFGFAAVATADISYVSQTDSARVNGFAVAQGFPFGSYDHTPSNNVLLAPSNYHIGDTTNSGPNVVSSSIDSHISATTFSNQGLMVIGSARAEANSSASIQGNTTAGAFQNYNLIFTIDAPTLAVIRVEMSDNSFASGSIGLLSNPVSVGWSEGPGSFERSLLLVAGSYNLNINTAVSFSTGGTNEHHVANMTFQFDLGVVPAPSGAAMFGLAGLVATRRRR